MTELKTLKELDLGINDSDVNCICGRQLKEHEWNFENKKQPCEDSNCDDFVPIKKVLRQEAIKWEKFQQDIQIHNPSYFNEYRLNIQWIKYFFNLTEEDLK